MVSWLDSQAQANAEEGCPRHHGLADTDGLEDEPLSHQVRVPEVVVCSLARLVEGPVNPWGPMVRATLAPLEVVVATLVCTEPLKVQGAAWTQSLITSFFTRG
jgi:hypothetical protein